MLKRLFFIFTITSHAILTYAQLTPQTVSIPMRDNKFLSGHVYVPPGCTQCPAILIQTPYNKIWFQFGLPLGIGTNLNNSNYAFVIVDWRGFYGSAPAYVPNPNRGEDGYDIIEWITQQSWSNGKVGTWGPSALGLIQYQTAKEQHPAHICAVPLVSAPQTKYTDYFPGGVYRREFVEQLDALGYGLSTVLLSNPVKNIYWNFVESSTWYPQDIKIPLMMIGGWYDHNIDGMLEFFQGIQTNSHPSVQNKHKLIMGPWAHGGNGTAYVGSLQQGELQYPQAAGDNDSLAMAFFDFYLRNVNNGIDNLPARYFFNTGLNTWVGNPPQPSNINFYLSDNAKLSFTGNVTYGDTTITYNPSDPSPTHGGATLKQGLLQGPYDQTSVVESRNDIAKFTSDDIILLQPGAFTINGKIIAHIFVSSDQTDTDIALRLTDFFPDGRSILISETIRRLRFRNGYTINDTAAAVPGQVYEMVIDFPALFHSVPIGHKLRLDFTSANYPRFDANPNCGGALYQPCDTNVAHNTIYYTSAHSSYLEVPFIIANNIEENTTQNYFYVYPNPTHDVVYIQTAENPMMDNFLMLTLSDVYGREILKTKITHQTLQLNLNNLSNGLYLISIANDKNQILQTKKIIKQ
jgi:predicted acyl esterase